MQDPQDFLSVVKRGVAQREVAFAHAALELWRLNKKLMLLVAPTPRRRCPSKTKRGGGRCEAKHPPPCARWPGGGSHIRQTAFPQLTGARITFRVVRNSNSEVRNPRLPFQVVSSHPRSR